MGIGKDQLVFDATDGGDVVAAFLKASDGTLITHTGGALNVANSVLTALSKAEDAAHVSGDQGIMSLAVRNDAGTTLAGTDGDYAPLSLDSSGRLRVVGSSQSDKNEDAAHASGDIGAYTLSVRSDTPASSTSADGDYQSFKTDALGRLWMNDAAHSFLQSAVSVTSTATDLVATDLANRKRIIIENNSTKNIFIGNSSVTAADGLKISAGSSVELPANAACDLYAITASGSADVRIFEMT